MFSRFQQKGKRDDLPTPSNARGVRPRNGSPIRRCRGNRLALCVVACIVVFLIFVHTPDTIPIPTVTDKEVDPETTAYEEWIANHPNERLPPTYEEYWAREAKMTRPHEPGVKYFFPARHIWGLGWGNAVQELLVNALLAHEANRSFVWDDYTWNYKADVKWSIYNDKLIHSRMPLSVLLDGPVLGEAFPEGDYTPRAVPKNQFFEICEKLGGIHYINNDEVKVELNLGNEYGALELFNRWVDKLKSIDAPCISNDGSKTHIFEMWLFGSRRIYDLWPLLRDSPIVQRYSSSPLVLLGLEANKNLLGLPRTPSLAHLSSPISYEPEHLPTSAISSLKAEQFDVIPGLLVLHIRRGDFDEHCLHLAQWTSEWQGFNQLASEGMPDKFERPDAPWGKLTLSNAVLYAQRCFPEIPGIVQRVREMRKEFPHLRRIYVMTNGKKDWIDELKKALMSDEEYKWDEVTGSRDLILDWEQKYVAQSVDMAIGTRADVLLGNGWSSFTAHLVMLRMAKGYPTEKNRFW